VLRWTFVLEYFCYYYLGVYSKYLIKDRYSYYHSN